MTSAFGSSKRSQNASSQPNYIGSFKVVLAGQAGVGKTSIVSRFMSMNEFNNSLDNVKPLPQTESTIGAAFSSKEVQVNNKVIKMEIWDTAGSERYHSLMHMYYRQAPVIIQVYDITSEQSFAYVKSNIKTLKTEYPNTLFYLVGNKTDLNTRRKVSQQLAEQSSIELGLDGCFEVSAMELYNIGLLFENIAQRLSTMSPAPSNRMNVDLDKENGLMDNCC